MIAGTLLSDPNFICKDGTVQNKIIILLSDGQSGTYVVAKTTSNGTHYGLTFGCQPLGRFPGFFLPRGACCLQKDTWVQLDTYFEFEAYDLDAKIVEGSMWQIGRLEKHCRELLSCALNSDDISTFQGKHVHSAFAAIPRT